MPEQTGFAPGEPDGAPPPPAAQNPDGTLRGATEGGGRVPSRADRRDLPQSARGRIARKIAAGLWIILAGAIAALAFGYLWPQSDIRDATWHELLSFAAFMVRTFLFQGGVAAVAACVVALVIKRWKLAAAWGVVAIFLIGPELRFYMPGKPPAVAGESVRVMSVNLLRSALDPEGMFAAILSADAEVLCLQEYSMRWETAIGERLRAHYSYFAITPREDSFGVAIFSRRPLIDGVRDQLGIGEWSLPQQRTAIEIDGRRVHLFNIHIPPPSPRLRPGPAGSHALEQRRCWRDLEPLLANISAPSIVVGDFNATLRSHIGAGMRGLGYFDTHELAGFGRGATWPADGRVRQYFPGVRIDHIYLRGLTATSSNVVRGPGSDHDALIAEIGFPAR